MLYAQNDGPNTRLPFRAAPDTMATRLQTFDPTGPVLGVSQIMEGVLSDSYIVGPGDGFLITIWGTRNESFETTVTPEGKLFIPQITEIPVAGLTLAAFHDTLSVEMGKFFFAARVSATLVRLRQFQVHVLGRVLNPGSYPAHAVTRAQEVIRLAGGLLDEASLRRIQVKRQDQVTESIDLLRFNRSGEKRFNPYVQDGDVIIVPQQADSVMTLGAVWVPGRYEFREDDTIKTLIELAQGFKPEAYREVVELIRFSEDGLTTTKTMLDLRDTTSTAWHMPLKSDDQIFVRSIPRWREKHRVTVLGEVQYPGVYFIDQHVTTLKDIVTITGGFTNDVSLAESFIIRSDKQVTVDPEYERLKLVQVEDMTSDEYGYFKMKARERPGRMRIDFQQLFENDSAIENIILKGGDVVTISKDRETIMLSGAVTSPGAIIFDPRLTIENYIERAGGFGWNARKNKTRVIKAQTGAWIWAKEAKTLGPGDTIWVPEKPNRDWLSIFFQGLATAGQIATIILVVDTVSK